MLAPALLAGLCMAIGPHCVANGPRCKPITHTPHAPCGLGFVVGLAKSHLPSRGHAANRQMLLLSPVVASCQQAQTREVWIRVEIPAQDY